MKAYFTRDSVCADDDGDAPHPREADLPDGLTLHQLVCAVVVAADLPSITGGRATWCVSSALPLAVIAQQWPEPRFLAFIPPKLSELDVSSQTIRLHFTYFDQQDPDAVYDVLRRLRLRAE